MFSDPVPPADSTPSSSGEWLPGETYYDHKQRMTELAADESQQQFQEALAKGDLNDPAVFLFVDSLYSSINSEINKETQRAKEASAKLKKSLEGTD